MKHVFLVILLLLFITSPVFATIIINEVQIEPEESVELLNASLEPIDISNWYLDDNGGTTFFTIPTNTVLQQNSCIVITASLNLNKSTPDNVRLFDSILTPIEKNSSPVAELSYAKSPGSGMSWQRMPDEGKQVVASPSSLGKWNTTNLPCIFIPTATPIPPFPSIAINEIMSNPSEGNEWIELYNASSFTAELVNWYIDTIEFSVTIPPQSYRRILILKNILNNNGDHVGIFSPTKQQVDYREFPALSQDDTYSKQADGTWCATVSSPDEKNNSCIIPTSNLITPTIAITTTAPTATLFPTIAIVSTAGTILGTTTHTKKQIQNFVGIEVSPFPSLLLLFFSLCALLCYTDSTDYEYIEKLASSFVRSTRKKRF